ncbi:MAG TPA: hypothetical protein VMQ62_11765 [Dongiaceae bacterium]|nr:hypothetical protein [Dongiaceae bacterium]
MSGTPRPAAGGASAGPADAGERHRALAELVRKQSRAHRALALLVEREVRLHVFLKKLADDAAAQQLQERSSTLLNRLGAKHVEQEETGRKEVWAHTQLAASTEARALAYERILDLEPGLGDEPVFQEPQESKEAAEARHLLDRHAHLVKEEETGRRRDITLTRLALGRLKRRRDRGRVREGLAGKTKEDDALRARRWTQSSRTHFAMARLLEKQRRAHLLVADLATREAARTPAGAAAPAATAPASEHPWARLKTATGAAARPATTGPAWAHQRLAARCAARAGWHEACAAYLATSLEASGAGPTRTASRRP